MRTGKLTDEAGRLAALDRYAILDTAPEQAFDKITALVKAVLQVPVCAVSLLDKDRQWFKSIQGVDLTETPREIAFCDHTIRTPDVLVVPDARTDERFADNPLVTGPTQIRSYAGVPLETPEGFNLGALCVLDVRSRTFTDEQIALLKQFAELVARELEMRSGSARDLLTGGLTRQGFDDALRHRLRAFNDQGEPCSLVVIDIDNFRTINDAWGREVGDGVLQIVAGCLRASLRADDVIGRHGGDVFAVILPGLTGYEAFGCSERLRNRIAQLVFPGTDVTRVTASCGVAGLQRGDSPDLWIAQAEGAVFAAKRGGRNMSISVDKLR